MFGLVVIVFLAIFVNFAFKKARLVREEGHAGVAPLVGFGGLAIAIIVFMSLTPVINYMSQP